MSVKKWINDKCQLATQLTAHNQYTSAVYYGCTSEWLTNVGLLLNWLCTMSTKMYTMRVKMYTMTIKMYTMRRTMCKRSVKVNGWQMSACYSIDCTQRVWKFNQWVISMYTTTIQTYTMSM